MITYLKKIRRLLVNQGSIRKYILYALGEIILVVIGILIALQINNWNEKNKALEAENLLLIEVNDALSSDSISIEGSQKLFLSASRYYENCFKVYQGIYPKDSLDNIRVMRRINLIEPIVDVNYPNLAAEVLSQEVKLGVLDYYQSLAQWKEFCDEYNRFIRNDLRPFLGVMQWQNYGAQYSDTINYFNTEKFFNDLSKPEVQQILFEAEQRTKGPHGKVMESYKNLKKIINEYIN